MKYFSLLDYTLFTPNLAQNSKDETVAQRDTFLNHEKTLVKFFKQLPLLYCIPEGCEKIGTENI